jgi:RNA polymerase sigma factor (sigma-70 family)
MTNALRKSLRALSVPGAGASDGELLSRFASNGDELAFETLVRRHGPMVLGVCRWVLRHAHDAEDAFQATFLVLARKARAVVKRDSVGGWLYRVAYHVALAAKGAIDRRRVRERQIEMPHPEVPPEEPQDWRPLLHCELARLPDKYREVVVLCDLEGLPRREVACRLGVPEGTLSSRLVFARRRLAVRLRRLGVGLPAGALVFGLSESTVSAALVSSTVRGATLLMAGEAAVATPAVALMKGALQTMFLQKLKVVAATAVVVLTLGVGGLAYRAGGQTAPAEKPRTGKPLTELEALRRENQLLKLNLEVVLEKVAALETEVQDLRGKLKLSYGDAKRGKELELWRLKDLADKKLRIDKDRVKELEEFKRRAEQDSLNLKELELRRLKELADKKRLTDELSKRAHADLLKQVEDALRMLREARDNEAADALEKALRSLRGKGTSPLQRR